MDGCIPVWPGHRSVARAIRQAREALRRGDVVCIFAEGSISRTGEVLPFGRGMEAIARDFQAPVVPVHLGGLWECIFSFRGGRFFWKWPRHLRHPACVSFGAPLPGSATAGEVRSAVVELEARAPGCGEPGPLSR
jgi:acyl-[acyl-carrier-protein]-phospholipid O-acyltransferase/long-chain-fatty-acid--[acyl-carrier-protein] ligase